MLNRLERANKRLQQRKLRCLLKTVVVELAHQLRGPAAEFDDERCCVPLLSWLLVHCRYKVAKNMLEDAKKLEDAICGRGHAKRCERSKDLGAKNEQNRRRYRQSV